LTLFAILSQYMTVNTEILRQGTENSANVIRKFTRRVQGTGIIMEVKGNRYHARSRSKAVTKKGALKRIARSTEYHKLVKEGKVNPAERRGRGGHRPQMPTTQATPAPTAAV
jgi:ribosomal protein S21